MTKRITNKKLQAILDTWPEFSSVEEIESVILELLKARKQLVAARKIIKHATKYMSHPDLQYHWTPVDDAIREFHVAQKWQP